jgi:group I intron endonuclease
MFFEICTVMICALLAIGVSWTRSPFMALMYSVNFSVGFNNYPAVLDLVCSFCTSSTGNSDYSGNSGNPKETNSYNGRKGDYLPNSYVEFHSCLTRHIVNAIKRNYKGVAAIYMFRRKDTGESYVGRTVNLHRRLTQYITPNYRMHNAGMLICSAITQHGIEAFELYILEIVSKDNLGNIHIREGYWYALIRSSYNIANIILPPQVGFDGKPLNRVDKNGMPIPVACPEQIRRKISATMTGRPKTIEERAAMSKAKDSKKAQINAYDSNTGELVGQFRGIMNLGRLVGVTGAWVSVCLNRGSLLKAHYMGRPIYWYLRRSTGPITSKDD